jgi:serine phosphatase RsbU (regulator of sigma subunit)/Tfp pilus assembly protein PilF
MKIKYKVFPLHFLFLLTSFFCLGQEGFAQQKTIDSLLTLLKKDKADTNKINHFDQLCWEYQNIGSYDTAMLYANSGLQLAQQLNNKKEIVNAYNNIGVVYRNKGNYSNAIDNYFKSLEIAEDIKNDKQIAAVSGNIGVVYAMQKKYPQALDYFSKALKKSEEQGNKSGIARFLANLGVVYSLQQDNAKALNYYLRALKMNEELGEKNAIENQLGNIGAIYCAQKKYSLALAFYVKALKMSEEMENKKGVVAQLSNIAGVYSATKKYVEAEKYLLQSMSISDSIGVLDLQMEVRLHLSETYEKTGRLDKALEMYKKAMDIKDTLYNQDKNEEIIRHEMNYEFSKKEAIETIEKKKQYSSKLISYGISVIITVFLILVIVLTVAVFRALRKSQKQQTIIEIKNTETELQKKIIEEKNKDITASIQYAKQIQNALLREEEHISKHLPEHFILFLPKDIVSGDFYWGVEKQEYWYFAAADCTGHGVPGAIMSMLGISFLNDIALSEGIHSPAHILNLLRKRIITELRQTGETGGNKDGMDISICCLNLKTYELQWAGANNALNIIRNGKLEETKADKQPIGYYPEMRPFTNHQLQMQKGDSIYIYSDGYADQFGGPKGKKLTYKRLEKIIIENNNLPMEEQKKLFKQQFIEWKGTFEQVDDVCLVGVRI